MEQVNKAFFDTLRIKVSNADKLKVLAETHEVNFNYIDHTTISIAINETTTDADIEEIIDILAQAENLYSFKITDCPVSLSIPNELQRTSTFMTNEVFENYHSETEMMRYIKKLERKDLSLNHSMISLGSCTMKLNAATEMLPLSWPTGVICTHLFRLNKHKVIKMYLKI